MKIKDICYEIEYIKKDNCYFAVSKLVSLL
jgi:hypothetical protein